MKAHQQNWTTTVSGYLLKRRRQTAQAYQCLTNDTSRLPSQFADTIFQSLFIIIGQELAQGHTVVQLYDDEAWQAKLLDGLLVDWAEIIDNPLHRLFECCGHGMKSIEQTQTIATDSSRVTQSPFNQDSFNQSPFYQALQQSSLDNTRQKLLKQRLSLACRLYQFFCSFQQNVQQCLQQQPDSSLTVLATFTSLLADFPLFVASGTITTAEQASDTQSISTQHAPIVFAGRDGQLTLWLHRSWQAERSIANNIERLNQAKPQPLDLSAINHSSLKAEQLLAIQTANHSAFSIITGGPGTGKTYTVAQLVIALHHANQQEDNKPQHTTHHPPLSLVLAAPTGKASQRMQESLQSALNIAGVSMNLQEAKTIHRLLGIGQSGVPRYGKHMPLSEDVIIVDEASMLGVELANYLLSAVKTGARLILLGDAHQLSAVEAGAVLGDLCQIDALQNVHANLSESTRFTADSAVGQLATLINSAVTTENLSHQLSHLFDSYSELCLHRLEPDRLNTLNSQGKHPVAIYRQLTDNYQAYFNKTQQLQHLKEKDLNSIDIDDLSELMGAFNQFRILTAGHHGIYGDDNINDALMTHHKQYLQMPLSVSSTTNTSRSSIFEWYHGRPVMVQQNNYRLGLFNGDIGLCVQTAEGLAVYFEGKDRLTAVNMLGDLQVTTAYAMTVHKSQGSEFYHVAVMLGVLAGVEHESDGGVNQSNGTGSNSMGSNNTLLNREMIYTAVTRAKKEVSIYSTLETLQTAITNPTVRQTGLAMNF